MRTVSASLRASLVSLPPAEAKVAQALLDDYPAAGLDTVASLAAAAGVSAPTVLRLGDRLGYLGFAEFQAALREELRHQSPIERFADHSGDEDPLLRSPAILTRAVEETFGRIDPRSFGAVVGLLADESRRFYATGGRFSSILAKTLVHHLEVLRPGTQYLSVDDRTSILADLGDRDVLLLVDLRRYQPSTIVFGEQASEAGARLVLITDEWLSPLAELAADTLVVNVDAPHLLDSMVPAMALIDALIAGVVDQLGDAPIDRMKRYDAAWAARGFGNDYWRRFAEEDRGAGS